MDQPTGKSLTGGFITSSVTRSGSTVRRTAGPWSPAVHGWLAHLAQAGVDVAPRPVCLVQAARIEEVTYVEGIALLGGASPGYLWRDDTMTPSPAWPGWSAGSMTRPHRSHRPQTPPGSKPRRSPVAAR